MENYSSKRLGFQRWYQCPSKSHMCIYHYTSEPAEFPVSCSVCALVCLLYPNSPLFCFSLSYFSPLNQFLAHFLSFFITATITAATSGELPPSQGLRYYLNSSPKQFSKAETTMMSIYRWGKRNLQRLRNLSRGTQIGSAGPRVPTYKLSQKPYSCQVYYSTFHNMCAK